jgi:hypothetical protein
VSGQKKLAFAAPIEVSTPQGPELQMDMSTWEMPMLLLEVSMYTTARGTELHLDVSGQQ